MYPKRLILDDARSLGIAVLGLDVNVSTGSYRIERLRGGGRGGGDDEGDDDGGGDGFVPAHPDLPDASDYGIRLSLADVRGINEAEVARIVAGAPYAGLADFWHRAHVSRPIAERLVLAGGFDSLYGMRVASAGIDAGGLGRRGRITRRDLLLHVAELDRYGRALDRSARRAAPRRRGSRALPVSDQTLEGGQVRARAAAQSQAALPVRTADQQPTQLALDLGDRPELTSGTGLPELSGPERVRAELDILGLDASAHVVDFYAPMLDALGVTRSRDLLRARSRSTVWACGVKVATQTPPIRTGRRVVFLTLDDSTGPIDATFFEDVQGPYAETVFHSWMLLVRGVVRRTGPRGISLRATGAWELTPLWDAWRGGGLEAVYAAMEASERAATEQAEALEAVHQEQASGGRRVLVHASGFRQSPYADTKPPGEDVRGSHRLGRGVVVPDPGAEQLTPPRKLWHSSPGSSGH
jgi:error-prone DNA polymerase